MVDSLVSDIEKRIDKFVAGLPAVEKELYSSILTEIKEFTLYSDGTIKNNLENIKRLGRIKRQMDSIVLNDAYLKDVSDFIGAYSSVEKTMNVYFSKLSSDFTPKKVLEEVKKQAINDAVEMLTENGISTNISQPLRDLIKTNVTSGGSYAQLTEQLRESILGTPDADGSLTKYAKTYATDAVNGYSGTYMKMVTDDLGLNWFRYVGSLIKTSRPFCIAMVKKSYVHKSEFTEILKGNIDGVKVSLSGVKKETTPENFQELRGGWQCGHQLIPISEESVPEEIKNKLKAKEPVKESAPAPQPEPAAIIPPKDAEKFNPAKTISEANNYAVNNLGAQYANYKGLNIDVANSLNQSMFEARQLMPDLKINGLGSAQAANAEIKKQVISEYKKTEWYQKLVTSYGQEVADKQAARYANRSVPKIHKGSIAYSSGIEAVRLPNGTLLDMSKYKGIFVNDKVAKSKAMLDEIVVNAEKSGWFTRGANDTKYIMQHEIGHEIDRLINFKNTPGFKEIFQREHKLGIDSVIDRLSKYGATAGKRVSHRPDEMIAEAWAEYVTSETPRQLAKEIGDLMLKQYYDDFVRGTGQTTFTQWKEATLKSIRI